MPLTSEEKIDSSFPCPDCGDHLESQAELVEHARQRHNKELQPAFKCRKCNKTTDTEDEIRQHLTKSRESRQSLTQLQTFR